MDKVTKRFLIQLVITILYIAELIRTHYGLSNLFEQLAVLLVMILALIILIKEFFSDDD